MRDPDFIIGEPDRPYLLRWWILPKNKWFNVYIHLILRNDDDRALHDHPWSSLSVILSGSYREITKTSRRVHRPGGFILRHAEYAHRLEVVNGPVWTLFITGPNIREWGFHCPKGWVHWQTFCATDDKGRIGAGCGEFS